MINDTLRRLALLAGFCLAQALVLNHIHLMGYATILLYVYFVILFPRNYPKWAVLIWSFLMGLSVDMFTNTPGLAAASLTLTGAAQPYLLEMFLPREAAEGLKTAASTLGFTKFFSLAAILVLLFCLLYFSLEAFTLFNPLQWALNIGATAVLTLALILAIETLRK
jgi:rod shape-determining protein MreD